jgi:4-diphosphocytidyl-2-C-methyl-D-erythritol kinase
MAITVSPDPSEAPHRIQTPSKAADETPSDNIACARLTLSAPAKLNLFLHITGRRDDGYHLLQTMFQLLDYGDTLTLSARADGAIELQDNIAGVSAEQNLIVRAARMLQDATGCQQGATINCVKRLPQGGGLGGGSSNAATTLVGLNHLWQTGLRRHQLAELGLRLGADVPVFVEGYSAWAEGVGEHLQATKLPKRYYLVIDPGINVPTARIFSDKQLTRNTEAITLAAFLEKGGRNDCEVVARRLFPEVERTFEWLSRYTVAHLTGTGGCVFATFADRRQVEAVAARIPSAWRFFIAQGVYESPLYKALKQAACK